MRYKKRGAWRLNCSVLRKGSSPGGQIIYKGEVRIQERDKNGDLVERTVDRFLVRIGKLVSETVIGTTADAETKLILLLAAHGKGNFRRADRITLESYLLEKFLPECRQRKLAGKTINHYQQDIIKHIIPALGSILLSKLDAQDLQAFVIMLRDKKGLDPKHIRNIYGCLRTALNRAVRMRLIEGHAARPEKFDIGELVQPSQREKFAKSQRKRRQAWSHEEILHFFRVAPSEAEMTRLALIGCRTGMRPGEICARRWKDFHGSILEIWTAIFANDSDAVKEDPDLEKWEMGPVKTGEGRTIRLDAETIAALKVQQAHVEAMRAEGIISEDAARFIFPALGGENDFLNPSKLYERWRFFVKGNKNKSAAGRDPKKGGRPPRIPLPGVRFISLYGWRHTHATELLREGEPEKFIAERLGTSVQMIRDHYGHILAETEARAIDSYSSYLPTDPGTASPDEVDDPGHGESG